MLAGVVGAGEQNCPLLLRISERSQRITAIPDLQIAHLLPVNFFSLSPEILSGPGISLKLTAGTAFVSLLCCNYSRARMFNPPQYSPVVLPFLPS